MMAEIWGQYCRIVSIGLYVQTPTSNAQNVVVKRRARTISVDPKAGEELELCTLGYALLGTRSTCLSMAILASRDKVLFEFCCEFLIRPLLDLVIDPVYWSAGLEQSAIFSKRLLDYDWLGLRKKT